MTLSPRTSFSIINLTNEQKLTLEEAQCDVSFLFLSIKISKRGKELSAIFSPESLNTAIS